MFHPIYKLKNFIALTKRPNAWKEASKLAKKQHPYCANKFCRTKKNLEADDNPPYRFVQDPSSHSVAYWLQRMIVLCHDCHRQLEHDSDPSYMTWNPSLRLTLAGLESFEKACTRDPPS